MKPPIRLLRLQNLTIYQQLQLEEALLRADTHNWCIINEGAPDAIVMGISGKPEELIDSGRFRQRPIPVIRRFSGGGCVYVDQDTLLITLILNRQSIPIEPFPQYILDWSQTLYQPLIADPTFRVRENDYVIGAHKFGGNAQCIVKNRWLHHSSLLWDFCPEKMQHLHLPSKRPHYRLDRAHGDFLCTLKPRFTHKTDFWDKFEHTLAAQFHVSKSSFQEVEPVLQAPHRKATDLLKLR